MSIARTPVAAPVVDTLMGDVHQPPHAEKDASEPTEVAFEQAVAGCKNALRGWLRAEAAFTHVSKMMTGQNPGCIISMPTGSKDEEDEQIIIQIDLACMFATVPEAQRDKFREQWLRPLYNYVVEDYKKWMQKLAAYTARVNQLLQSS
jgi:hypothetical protein